MQTIMEKLVWEALANLHRKDIKKLIKVIKKRKRSAEKFMLARNELDRIKINYIWDQYKHALNKSYEPYDENIR